jgi:crossover junction endonuclease MUS81
MYKIYLDTHELKIIEKFTKDYIIVKPLDIGDIQIINQNETNGEIKIELIIERKTFADLYSSILDGRYKEQKARLESYTNFDNTKPKLIYLIEGQYGIDKHINYDTIDSALLGSSIRDNYKIIYSVNIDHTIKLIDKTYNKIDEYINKNTNTTNYINTVKTCKKENLTPDKCYILQLACIPNLSTNIAENIAKIYPTFEKLIEEIKLNEKIVYEKIKETKINNRKIGPVLSAKLIKYLMQN